MSRELSPPKVSLNPGEQVDQFTYDFERKLLMPRISIVAGQILSLYFIFTPTNSETPTFSVYDVFIHEINPLLFII